MKLLVTGANGMLGRTLVRRWREDEIIPAGRAEFDICDAAATRRAIEAHQPDAVVHCAAFSRVDACESDPDFTFGVNADGAANVAAACKSVGARMAMISSDYVFGGSGQPPFSEADAPEPLNVYGRSKLAGEQRVREILPDALVVRIAWLYGQDGPSFLHTMLALGREDSTTPVRVVADQVGNPTSAAAVADHLHMLLAADASGLFHLTCEGQASWYEFARAIWAEYDLSRPLESCTTDAFPRPAERPADSRLRNDELQRRGFDPMPHWTQALKSFATECPNG